MQKTIKNLAHGTAFALADEVQYLDGQIVSKTVAQTKHHSMTLFAFEKGEEISAHKSSGDAFVTVLDGTGKFTVGGNAHLLVAGQAIVMPAGVPHAVYGEERFKMLLVVLFPEEGNKGE